MNPKNSPDGGAHGDADADPHRGADADPDRGGVRRHALRVHARPLILPIFFLSWAAQLLP